MKIVVEEVRQQKEADGYAKAVSLSKQGQCLDMIEKPGTLHAYQERSFGYDRKQT